MLWDAGTGADAPRLIRALVPEMIFSLLNLRTLRLIRARGSGYRANLLCKYFQAACGREAQVRLNHEREVYETESLLSSDPEGHRVDDRRLCDYRVCGLFLSSAEPCGRVEHLGSRHRTGELRAAQRVAAHDDHEWHPARHRLRRLRKRIRL